MTMPFYRTGSLCTCICIVHFASAKCPSDFLRKSFFDGQVTNFNNFPKKLALIKKQHLPQVFLTAASADFIKYKFCYSARNSFYRIFLCVIVLLRVRQHTHTILMTEITSQTRLSSEVSGACSAASFTVILPHPLTSP